MTPRPLVLSLSCMLALAACSGNNNRTVAPLPLPGEDFKVVAMVPPNNGTVFLNDPIQWLFNAAVDLDSVSLNTIRFTVFDAVTGETRDEAVAGSFRFARRGGNDDQTLVEFRPRMPGDAPYTDGGLRPRRRYAMSLLSADTGPALRDVAGRRLRAAPSLQVFTPAGSSPAELFRNPRPGGPRVLGFEVVPSLVPAQGTQPAIVPLNLLAHAPIELRLRFDQALDPSRANLPQSQSLDPLRRAERRRGPIYLVYDDPEFGRDRWIPTLSLLERNDETGAEVVVIPDGVLPNNALVRVIVEPILADIAGETNLNDPGHQRLVGSFRTMEGYDPQFDAARADFDRADLIDPGAVFLDPPARLVDGGLHAALEFEGRDTQTDLNPTSSETIINTDAVPNGMLTYRNVTVAAGASVRAVGTNPLVLLVTGNVRVDGTLSVTGGNGARVDTLNSANIPTPGGVAACTGGNGGRGSPEATRSDLQGETGYGPHNQPGLGGLGGYIACGNVSLKRGSGGGGGSHATAGDPLYNDGLGFANSWFVQYLGTGGGGYTAPGGTGPNLQGGGGGPVRGRDGNPDNDFFGRTVDLARRERVLGEFLAPAGGAGGGGGGDRSVGEPCQSGPVNFINDNKGGGGGAGGGVLIIKALGSITVGPVGRIAADGGHGGGGEQAGSNNEGGGGGGGAGGMVVLMAGSAVVLHRHGGPYSIVGGGTRDYAFSVTAEGGASLRGDFGGSPILGKYPVRDPVTGVDSNSGGFGGMGVVQLMAPPGDNSDGTNTILDDNVHILESDGVTRMYGAAKQRFIAWIGMRGRDDAGNPIPNYGGGGDIRPRPHLLPPTFSRYSRARTRWIATGATVRRELTQPDGQARGVVATPPELLAGPEYSFAGTAAAGTSEAGYLSYDRSTGLQEPPVLFPRLGIAALEAFGGMHLGRAVHKVTLTGTPLGTLADRHAHLRLVLHDSHRSRLGDFRILTHTSNEVLLDPDDGELPVSAASGDLVARLVDVWTDQRRGLGATYGAGAQRLPVANARIGFAFHADPTNPDLGTPGSDLKRYPQLLETFVYDLTDPVVRATVRDLHAQYFQVDVRFTLDYTDQNPDSNSGGNGLRLAAPRPEIRSVALPYRF